MQDGLLPVRDRVITLLIGVMTPLITGMCQPCRNGNLDDNRPFEDVFPRKKNDFQLPC